MGKPVQVHYDPAEPAESVLEPGPTWSGSALYFIGLGLMTLGGLLGGRRDATPGFPPVDEEPMRSFDRPLPRPLGGRPSRESPADDDGIEIV